MPLRSLVEKLQSQGDWTGIVRRRAEIEAEGRPELLGALGLALVHTGEAAAALPLLQSGLQDAPAGSPRRRMLLLGAAQAAAAYGDPLRAEAYYQEYLAGLHHCGDVPTAEVGAALLGLGEAFSLQSEWERALQCYEMAAAALADDDRAAFRSARLGSVRALVQAGRLADAWAILAALEPELAAEEAGCFLGEMARLERALGLVQQAEEVGLQALRRLSQLPERSDRLQLIGELHLLLAAAYRAEGRQDACRRHAILADLAGRSGALSGICDWARALLR